MRPERLRTLVLAALEEILDRGGRADRVLERVLRANRDLTGDERAVVARRVLAISCLRGRLDFLLARCCPGWNRSPAAWRLAAFLVSEEGLEPELACSEAGLEAGSRLDALRLAPAWPADAIDRLAAERSLPPWLARLWHEQLGDEADALAAAMNRPGPVFVRANRLRCTPEQLARELAKEGVPTRPTRLSPDGLELLGRMNVFGSDAWRGGLFEVQDEGSQLIARLAAPRPGQLCVDFCAGAGGKTLALAALMEDRGRVVALDIDAQRLADLRPRLARAGVGCVQALRVEPEGPVPGTALGADVVLVDAPCSSLGTLRRGPDARWRIRPEDVDTYPRVQRGILARAAHCVRPGGRLVYATCTLNRAENEDVAAAFSAERPEFAEVPIAATLGPGVAAQLGDGPMRLMPHRHGCDGFFACMWERRA